MKQIALLASIGISLANGSSPSLKIPLTKVPVTTDVAAHESEQRVYTNKHGHTVQASNLKRTMHRRGHNLMGEVFFGDNSQPANVTFDTGSEWVSVTADVCNNCDSKAFSPAKSKTIDETRARYEIEYEEKGWALNAFIFKDKVCMLNTEETDAANFCVFPMEFYAIYEQTGLKPYEQGILGIAPLTTHSNTREYHDSFVMNLKD